MNSAIDVAPARDEILVAELHRLGVRHLVRLQTGVEFPPLSPVELIAALAASRDARVQASLILLFLRRPDYALSVREAAARLDRPVANELMLYYQAAGYLQGELEHVLLDCLPGWHPLPDLFSPALGLPPFDTPDTGSALRHLGGLHRKRSGLNCDWAGSYRQNISRFLKHLEHDCRNHWPGAN